MKEKRRKVMNFRLNILSSCNLRCKHCYYENKVWFDDQEMSLEDAKKVVDEAYKVYWDNLHIVVMWWWEPFMYKYLFELLEYIRLEKKVTCAITSNMTLANREKLSRLAELWVHIHASIEWNEEYNDYVRWKWVFRKVINNMQLARELWVRVSINMTLNRFNIKYIPYVIKLFTPISDYFTFSRYIPYFKDDKIKELLPNDYRLVQRLLAKYKKDDFVPRQEQFLKIDKDNISTKKKDFSIYDLRSLYILPDMTIYPSWNLIDYKLGDLREDSLENILNNWKAEDLFNPDNLKGLCGKCKYRYNCGWDRWVAYFYTWDFFWDDIQCPFIKDWKLEYNIKEQ